MERIAFDLVITKKGVLYNIFNEKIIGYIGFTGLLSILGFIAVYYKVYEINLLEYALFQLLIFLFSICVYIRISGDVDGTYLKKKGLLFFDENEITIDFTEIYPLTKVTFIEFRISDFLGAVMRTNSDGSYKRRAIVCNHLEFQYKQKIYEYQFIIESERQKQLLIEKVIPQMQAKTKVTYLVY